MPCILSINKYAKLAKVSPHNKHRQGRSNKLLSLQFTYAGNCNYEFLYDENSN